MLPASGLCSTLGAGLFLFYFSNPLNSDEKRLYQMLWVLVTATLVERYDMEMFISNT